MERGLFRHRGHLHRKAITKPPLARDADHEVDPVALHFEDPVARLRREEPDAISTRPPQATADWRRASERALPWPLAAPMSVRRQRSVQLHSSGMVGLVQVLHATLLGSSWGESNEGGGTTLATRSNSEGGRPMCKSTPSGPAMCAAKKSPRRWPVMRRLTSPIRWS